MALSGVQFNLPFSLGIGDFPPEGIDPIARAALGEVYSALRQLQLALHNHVGMGQQLQSLWSSISYLDTLHKSSPWRLYIKASEAITYGFAINLHLSGGVLQARLANATNNTKPCHGFCTTAGNVASGAYGEFILMQGLLTSLAGLTVGTRYFLSTTNGLITATAPVAAGNIEQALGIAVDTSALLYCTDFDFIQH